MSTKKTFAPSPRRERPKRTYSDIREILSPAALKSGYDLGMSGQPAARGIITREHLANVSRFLKSRCTPDQPESWHVARSGIPQATFSSAKRGVKLGWGTAARLAEYFGWGEDVQGFLSGTEPAGAYTLAERGLPVGYPNRGLILDRFRGVFAPELLQEVQQIVLPADVPDWSPATWAAVVLEKANEWKRLGKYIEPTWPPPGGPNVQTQPFRRKA